MMKLSSSQLITAKHFSSILGVENDTYRSPRSVSNQTPSSEKPPFKYNPNTGKTFESKVSALAEAVRMLTLLLAAGKYTQCL